MKIGILKRPTGLKRRAGALAASVALIGGAGLVAAPSAMADTYYSTGWMWCSHNDAEDRTIGYVKVTFATNANGNREPYKIEWDFGGGYARDIIVNVDRNASGTVDWQYTGTANHAVGTRWVNGSFAYISAPRYFSWRIYYDSNAQSHTNGSCGRSWVHF